MPDKWIKTVRCGCDECRFKDPATRGVCSKINEPGAIWLWALNPEMIGLKDYIDPTDFVIGSSTAPQGTVPIEVEPEASSGL